MRKDVEAMDDQELLTLLTKWCRKDRDSGFVAFIGCQYGDLLLDYSTLSYAGTTIAERWSDQLALNVTPYSPGCTRVQQMLASLYPEEKLTLVSGIAEGYDGIISELGVILERLRNQ